MSANAPHPPDQEPEGKGWLWALLTATTLASLIGIYSGVAN